MIFRNILISFITACAPNGLLAADDLPSHGYSLFDRLFSEPGPDGYVHAIPYPFADLLAQLEQKVPGYSSHTETSLVKVLIPRGRSLQREAASPNYYQFPRIVVALDQDSEYPVIAKNRLFLGYQEKAGAIEVISYNEAAGRFEFQVVENYVKGGTPRVNYASRSLCTSCHQNSAAIFARPRWRESNFNNAVVERIDAYQQRFHGVIVNANKGDAARFDFATDQAGLFNAYQQVWQLGCETDTDLNANRGCRAGLFFAVVQQAIASVPRPQYQSPLVEHNLMPILRQNWKQRWPGGMPVASADIDDRPAPTGTGTDLLTPEQDPLNLRSPLAHWSYKSALRRTIQGIGEQFLLHHDLIELNRLLRRQVSSGQVLPQTLNGDCRLEFTEANNSVHWLNLNCRFDSNADGPITIEGEIRLGAEADTESGQGKLLINGTAGWARVEVVGTLKPEGQERLRLELQNGYQHLAARLWDNRIVSGFEITLPDSKSQGNIPQTARLVLSDDLGAVERAVGLMLKDANDGQSSIFDKRPIPGSELMQSLLLKLGASKTQVEHLPIPKGLLKVRSIDSGGATQTAILDPLATDSPLRLVFRYCGACHSENTATPPGFLAGDIKTIATQLNQCAPRILRRLSVWHNQTGLWQQSPMPPPASLEADNFSQDSWRDSRELIQLQVYFRELVSVENSATIEARNYDKLPHCYSD